MTVYLIGYMGVGKTTIGKRLARRLNMKYCDLDQYIESHTKLSISEIFAERGEAHFRILERKALENITDTNLIIATGGGAPCHFDNLTTMRQKGIVVWLNMDLKILINRLISAKAQRPLLANL